MSVSVSCLCPPGGLAVEGLAAVGDSGRELAVTIQGDGVVTYDVEQQARTSAWVLGSKASRFAGPVAFLPAADCVVSAVRNLTGSSSGGRLDQGAVASTAYTIVCSAASGSSRLLDSQQRLPASNDVFALHPLPTPSSSSRGSGGQASSFADDSQGPVSSSSSGGAAEGAVAVVCRDGSVAAVLVSRGGKHARYAAGSRACRGARVAATAVGANGLFVVSSDATSQQQFVDVFEMQVDAVRRKGGFQLSPPSAPGAGCRVVGASVVGSRLVVVWGDGSLQAYGVEHLPQQEGAASIPVLQPSVSMTLPGLALAGFASPAAAAAAGSQGVKASKAANGKLATPAGKKRSAASLEQQQQQGLSLDGPPSGPTAAMVPLQQDMVAVVAWQQAAGSAAGSGGAGAALMLAAVDVRYGVVRLVQRLSGGSGGGQGQDSATQPLSPLGPTGAAVAAVVMGPGRLGVAAGGAVLAVEARLPPVSLARLVGSASRLQQQGGGPVGVGPSGRASQQPWATSARVSAVAWGQLQRLPELQDAEALAGASWAAQLAVPQEVRWDVGPAAQAAREEAACLAKLPSLKGAALDALSDGVAQAGPATQGQDPVASPGASSQALVAAVAARLVETQRWEALGRLLASPACPRACPGLLPALAGAARYADLAGLLARGVDVSAQDLAGALQQLLTLHPTAAQQSAQASLHARMTGVPADAAAASPAGKAEQPVGNGITPGKGKRQQQVPQQQAGGPGAGAHAGGVDPGLSPAAALLHSFTPAQSTLHPLVAPRHDAGMLTSALRALPAPEAGALLCYLAVWLRWYAQGLAAAAPLSPLGPLPCLQAVVDWACALLDAQLMSLCMHVRGAKAGDPVAAALQELRAVLSAHEVMGKRASPLQGALQHLLAGAALPMPRAALAMAYSVELLDLSVRE